MKAKRSMSWWCNYSPVVPIENWGKLTERTDWKFRCVVEKFEVGIDIVNHDAVNTSSKNLKVSRKRRSTSGTIAVGFGVCWMLMQLAICCNKDFYSFSRRVCCCWVKTIIHWYYQLLCHKVFYVVLCHSCMLQFYNLLLCLMLVNYSIFVCGFHLCYDVLLF